MAGGNLIHVATILGAHGVKGEVKVKSLTSVPKAFAGFGPLAARDGRMFEFLKSKQAKDHFICVLSTVADRNAAEGLRGAELFVAREKLPTLKEGEVYLSDVQGKVAMADGKVLGHIIGFQNFGAGELMELDGGMLIPVSFIGTVAETVALNLPEGYLGEE